MCYNLTNYSPHQRFADIHSSQLLLQTKFVQWIKFWLTHALSCSFFTIKNKKFSNFEFTWIGGCLQFISGDLGLKSLTVCKVDHIFALLLLAPPRWWYAFQEYFLHSLRRHQKNSSQLQLLQSTINKQQNFHFHCLFVFSFSFLNLVTFLNYSTASIVCWVVWCLLLQQKINTLLQLRYMLKIWSTIKLSWRFWSFLETISCVSCADTI